VKKFNDNLDNFDKIPFDHEPIYRNSSSRSQRVQSPSAKPSGVVSLLLAIVVIFNFILSGVVIKLVMDNKNKAPITNNIYIETTGGLDVTAVANKVRTSVVSVHAGYKGSVSFENFYNMSSRGSGVIIEGDKTRSECYILTCYHVVRGYLDEIYVLLNDSVIPVKVTLASSNSFSKMYDLALLKLTHGEYSRSASEPCEVADSSLVCAGDAVVAYGNPRGNGPSVTDGSVSKTSSIINVENVHHRLIETSAPINVGNSGGGLFDAWGRLIGIVSAKANDAPPVYIDNIAYAIPSNVAISVARNMMRHQRPLKAVVGLRLAVTSNTIQYEIVDNKLLPRQEVVVTGIDAQSAAAFSDFKVGDIIISFEYSGKEVQMRNIYSLEDEIFNLDRGATMTFTVKRSNGKVEKIDVKISNAVAADAEDWYAPR